jgi:transglutaminase-like putative cysteine protease
MTETDLMYAFASEVEYTTLDCQSAITAITTPIQAELLRRLARPDALREQVMAAFDPIYEKWAGSLYMSGGDVWDDLKAAVAAVLEGV